MNVAQRMRYSRTARRLFPLYGTYRRQCAAADEMDRDQRLELREQRMRQLIRRAALAGMSIDAMMTKPDVRTDPARYRRPVLGPVSKAATGGTTGIPLQIERSIANVVFEQATIDHVFQGHGIDAALARVAVFRGDNIKAPDDQSPPYWRDFTPTRRVFSSIHLNRSTAAAISKGLAEFKPDVLYFHPSSLSLLLEYAREGLLETSPRLVVTSSEYIAHTTFADVPSILGCPLLDYYGQAERVCFASSDRNGRYRFRHDYGAVVLDPHQDEDRVIGSSFHNNRQLFYRYDTGDTTADTSAMGQGQRRLVELGLEEFGGIKGRVGERMDLPDGRQIVGFNQIPRNVSGVDSVQFIRTGEWSLDVLVVKGATYSEAALDSVRKNLELKVPSDVGTRFVFSDVPQRNRSGKALVYIDARTD